MQKPIHNKKITSKIEKTGHKLEKVEHALYLDISSWIKAHPILTLLFSFLLSVVSNLVSQWLWHFFK